MGIIYTKIKNFWIESFNANKKAFKLEVVSFFSAVTASLYLAINAQNPQMEYIYPIFFIAAFTSTIAHYRRKVAFPMLLTIYFCIVNIFGFGRAIGIW
tara:strand:- start:154 stop:447 length:294 start_codon:yes stop_codon:yes gene_type:complete